MALQPPFPQRSSPARRDRGDTDLVLPLPAQTEQFIERQRQIQPNGSPFVPENLGLWLDRLIPVNRGDTKEPWGLTGEARQQALSIWCGKHHESKAGAQALGRQKESIAALHIVRDSQGLEVRLWRSLRAEQKGRLLVDAGRAHPLSTSLSFHPLWGVPRIPGSALKGAVRSLAEADGARLLTEAMGTQEKASQVVFFDALPVQGKFRIDLDVLTPHYGEYYAERAPPTERLSPKPHTFLTVVETTFEICFAVELESKAEGADFLPDFDRQIQQATARLELTETYLKMALVEWGIGGKTSAGYGRFVLE